MIRIWKKNFCLVNLLNNLQGVKMQCRNLQNCLNLDSLDWDHFCGICTDGATVMLAIQSGFVIQKAPYIIPPRCMIHRQALPSKTLLSNIKGTLDTTTKIVLSTHASSGNSDKIWMQFMKPPHFIQQFADNQNEMYFSLFLKIQNTSDLLSARSGCNMWLSVFHLRMIKLLNSQGTKIRYHCATFIHFNPLNFRCIFLFFHIVHTVFRNNVIFNYIMYKSLCSLC